MYLISCASFTALLSPSHPGAAARKATGLSSSCSASSGAASSDRGRAGGAVHVRVSHPGKKLPSSSAPSWPHRFSTGQGRRHPTASCPLLGPQHRGTSVSLHPGVGEAPKTPSPWAGMVTWPRSSLGTTHCSAAAVGHIAVAVSASSGVEFKVYQTREAGLLPRDLCPQSQKDVGRRRRTICMKTSFSTGPK